MHATAKSRQLSILPSVGWEMSSSLRAMASKPTVADWGGGMSVGCTVAPTVRWLHNVLRYH